VFKTRVVSYGRNTGQKFNECVYFSHSRLCQSNLSKHGHDNKHTGAYSWFT